MNSEQRLPSIRVIHHLARCGGTLICRCLGSMREVVLLSEVHPHGMKVFDPLKQARDWFQLLTDEDLATVEPEGPYRFLNAIELIHGRAEEQDKTLVLRDWTHLDFTGVPFNIPLTYRLTSALQLRHRFRVVQVATVRHPINQWLSFHKTVSQDLQLDSFLYGYRRFAEVAAEIGFVRYEDFVAQPESQMQTLCDQLEVNYDAAFIDKWPQYQTITGNTGGGEMTCSVIEQRARRPSSPELLEQCFANEDYRRAIEVLGYRHE